MFIKIVALDRCKFGTACVTLFLSQRESSAVRISTWLFSQLLLMRVFLQLVDRKKRKCLQNMSHVKSTKRYLTAICVCGISVCFKIVQWDFTKPYALVYMQKTPKHFQSAYGRYSVLGTYHCLKMGRTKVAKMFQIFEKNLFMSKTQEHIWHANECHPSIFWSSSKSMQTICKR